VTLERVGRRSTVTLLDAFGKAGSKENGATFLNSRIPHLTGFFCSYS